jgi:hypothetical protein
VYTNGLVVVNLLIHLYFVHVWSQTKFDSEAPRANGRLNGHAEPSHRTHDAEDFELESLISEDEVDEPHVRSKELQPSDAHR